MDYNRAMETRKIVAGAAVVEADFVKKCKSATFTADGDCFVDFDQSADTGSMLLKANVPSGQIFGEFTKITAITSGATVNIYVLATR